MKIKCPQLFQDEILEAHLVEAPSFFSRDKQLVLEITAHFTQIEAPGTQCEMVAATPEEVIAFRNAGYTFCK